MYRTWLIPYLEGTLGMARRAELEARLAEDPALAADLDALRRTLPRLRAALRPPAALTVASEPLWPRLRPQLEQMRPRPARIGPAWWAVGTTFAVLLLASSLANRQAMLRHRRADVRWLRELRHAPLIVFHRDNGLETATAARLQQRARQIAQEKQAAW